MCRSSLWPGACGRADVVLVGEAGKRRAGPALLGFRVVPGYGARRACRREDADARPAHDFATLCPQAYGAALGRAPCARSCRLSDELLLAQEQRRRDRQVVESDAMPWPIRGLAAS